MIFNWTCLLTSLWSASGVFLSLNSLGEGYSRGSCQAGVRWREYSRLEAGSRQNICDRCYSCSKWCCSGYGWSVNGFVAVLIHRLLIVYLLGVKNNKAVCKGLEVCA